MFKIKTDTYYDVTCYACARSMSTDFDERGMAPTQKEARAWAKEIGFVNYDGRNFCPECVKRLHIKKELKPQNKTPKKHYLIQKNNEEKFWNWTGGTGGNGGWETTGSYYKTKKAAEKEIKTLKLDGHVDYDIW